MKLALNRARWQRRAALPIGGTQIHPRKIVILSLISTILLAQAVFVAYLVFPTKSNINDMPAPSSLAMRTPRIAAAIRGAFLADAASMGTHWIYDPDEMANAVPAVNAPEFLDPPSPRYYSSAEYPGHYARGQLSPYGEQLLFVTEHVASAGADSTVEASSGITGKAMSLAMLEWAETFGGRPDSALKAFVENMKSDDASNHWPNCGADDHEAHIYMKIVPVTCRYAGSSELIAKVTEAIRVHQNNDKAVAFGIASARILEEVLLGAPLAEALSTVEKNLDEDLLELADGTGTEIHYLRDVKDAFERAKTAGGWHDTDTDDKTLSDVLGEVSREIMKGKENSPFYNLAGRSCALPGSFIGPLALFFKTATAKNEGGVVAREKYVAAIRENILASGDTCSRGIFIGAVMAAAGCASVDDDDDDDGLLPSNWMDKVDNDTMNRVNAAISKIIEGVAKSE